MDWLLIVLDLSVPRLGAGCQCFESLLAGDSCHCARGYEIAVFLSSVEEVVEL